MRTEQGACDRKRDFLMKLNARWVSLALQSAAAVAFASQAIAGCGDLSTLQPPFQFAQPAAAPALRAMTTANAVRFNDPMSLDTSPIGMWNIQFSSQGNTSHTPPIPDGALVDFGYAQWHSHGTEIMNSGAHAANT